MSMPHNFSDDPNAFPGPPSTSNNTTVILVVIAIIGGTLMLICGGVIFGVVMTVRQAQRDFEITMGDQQWQAATGDVAFQEYSRFVAEGRYSEALESVNSDLEYGPDSAYLHNNKAWLLATCPDDDVRDGELAVEHATKACELSGWNNVMFLDTLAAAYAETGDFESAVKWQKEAIRLDNGAFAVDFQKRLRLFEAGKVYREGVPPYKDMEDESMDVDALFDAEVGDTTANEADETTTPDEQPEQ